MVDTCEATGVKVVLFGSDTDQAERHACRM